jgi:hypothetical protein
MADLNQWQAAQNVSIVGQNGPAVVTDNVSGNPQALVVRNIPTSGYVQPVAETPESSVYFAPTSYNSSNYESFGVAKVNAGNLFGFCGYNASDEYMFLQVHNTDVIPQSGDSPTVILNCPPCNNFFWDGGKFGIYFSSGMTWTSSVTGNVYTPQTNQSGTVWVNIFYK